MSCKALFIIALMIMSPIGFLYSALLYFVAYLIDEWFDDNSWRKGYTEQHKTHTSGLE